MNIIIGNPHNPKLKIIASKIPNSVVTNTYCKLKYITEPVSIIIPIDLIKDNGFITNTEISLDELLLKLNVINIVYGNLQNKELLKKYQDDYHIKVNYFQF